MSNHDHECGAPGRCPQQSACVARRVSRRSLLSLAGTSTTGLMVVAAAGLPGCGNPTGSPPAGPVDAGDLSSLTVGTMLTMSNVVIARDAGGVYAMSAVCTHAGCYLDDKPSTIAAGLYCPCHGSTFDGDGRATGGPARSALQHYAVTISSTGKLTVEGGQPVAPTTRTPVG